MFVQYFAVQVVAGLKDKSSAEPLRQFAMDAERRRKRSEALDRRDLDAARQKEAFALMSASQIALMAIPNPIQVKIHAP